MKILSRTIRKSRGKHYARIRYQDEDGNKHELFVTSSRHQNGCEDLMGADGN